jgi:hypothetical protein
MMQQIISQFELQTRLFKNATKGFDETSAGRKNGEANHAKWLTGHTVSSRYALANVLGLNQAEPFPELFSNRKGNDDSAQYPSMNELVKSWDSISDKLIARLKEMKDADFNAREAFPTPLSDGTTKGLINFLHTMKHTPSDRLLMQEEYMEWKPCSTINI